MVMHNNVLSLFLRDVRYAVRTFSHRPTFTAIVVLTLALGIGSSVAIFSVANAVLLRPLPFEDPAPPPYASMKERAGLLSIRKGVESPATGR